VRVQDRGSPVDIDAHFTFGFETLRIDCENFRNILKMSQQRLAQVEGLRQQKYAGRAVGLKEPFSGSGTLMTIRGISVPLA
jgi:hypothetical protein